MCVSKEVTEHLSSFRSWETELSGVLGLALSLVNSHVEREKDDQSQMKEGRV